MKKSDFMDQYKDPRWQKKRLEILQRDDFKCQSCTDDENQLHVHHIYYKKGLKPWEYDNVILITLCEECHKTWHILFDNKELNSDCIILVARLFNKIEQAEIQRRVKAREKQRLEKHN